MSIMIPDFINHQINSTAEKRVFDWFQNNPSTKDWTVLYSQIEINHNSLIIGESDFVVLAPGKGIFVLEVKGGRINRDEEGIWHFIDKSNHDSKKSRGPFEQASDGMFSLKKYIETQNSNLKGLIWGYGIMVPDMESFYISNNEYSPYMIFNKTMGNRVDLFINNLSQYNIKKFKETYHITDVSKMLPSSHQCRLIKEILRPSFDYAPSMSSLMCDAISEQLHLTDEEYTAIDATEDNKHCLFVGGAGTGKTLIAKEIARRSKETNICFLCFNNNLGEWIKKDFEEEGILQKCSFVGDMHSLIFSNIKKAELSYKIDWSNSNPLNEQIFNLFFESLKKCPLSFDFLIVDELQDLLDEKKNCLLALDSILNGGLGRGHFAFFGDFDNQSIYNPYLTEKEAFNQIQEFSPIAKWRLTINCRNTPEICKTISEITGVKYKKINSFPSYISTSFVQYSDENDEKIKLDQILKDLLSTQNHVNKTDIVILATKRRENSVIKNYKNSEIDDFSIPKSKSINFSTIFSFKGLESPIVIMVDIDSYSNTYYQNNESLIYVGISRAKAKLIILESDKAAVERIMLSRNKYHE